MKATKWIIRTLAALALLATLAVAYLVFAIDPNSYKPQLAELAQEQNIALNIEGELSWQLLPSLALSIGATQIASPRADIPAISFEQADLNLAWLPLLKRQLSVKAIHLEGADIRLSTTEQAANTAIAPLAAAPTTNKTNDTGETTNTTEAAPAFTLAIESLEISNSRLQLPPTAAGTSPQQLSDINLLIQGLNLAGEVFKLKARFNYSDPALPEPMAVVLDTDASVEQHTQSFTLRNTELDLLMADKPAIELRLDALSAGQQATPQLTITGLRLDSAGASLQASLSAHSLDDKLAFESDITVPPLALRKVLANWAIELPDLSNKETLQEASLKLSIKGSGDALTISHLKLTLDDITLAGSTAVDFGPTRSVALQLHGNTIDLNRYLTSTDTNNVDASETTDEQQTNAAAEVEPAFIFAPLVAPLLWVGDGNAAL
ncbi:MAG: AsmA family protein, partial [Candidatus Reddybacter sp.]